METKYLAISTFVSSVSSLLRLKKGECLRIAVAGNIGVGKSTFIKEFSNFEKCDIRHERFDDNPYLADFYKDPAKYAFQTQMWFLGHRMDNNNRSLSASTTSLTIFDRHLIEDEVFAKANYLEGNINITDKGTYDLIFQNVIASSPMPHLILYLKAGSMLCNERILKRSRDMETNAIDPGYLMTLENCYDNFENKWSKHEGFLTLDWSEFHDFGTTLTEIVERLTTQKNENFYKVNESREI